MTAANSPAAPPDRLGEELFNVRHQALLRAILDNLSEGISIADAAGNFIYNSSFARRIYSVGESITEAPEEWAERFGLFLPDEKTHLPLAQMPIWEALRGNEVRDFAIFVRNANVPQGIHVTCTCKPLFDEKGQLLGAIAFTQDVDKQHKIEAEKQRTEQRFQLLVETAQEGVWTIDTGLRTTYANRYLADLLGYTPSEMMGMHLFSFLDEENQQRALKDLAREGKAPKGEIRDYPFLRKDGSTVWTSISTTPLFDEQGCYAGSLGLLTDITQRRAAEEQVRRLNEELEDRIAERTAQLEFSNRELESFAYTVAHDLRAPLRSIATFSDALLEDYAGQLDEAGQEYVRRIAGGARRMNDLIDGILSLSRANSTALAAQRCDLSFMARSVAEQLQRLEPARAVQLSIQEGMVDQGDPRLLRGVLENLLGNAWKFTRERPAAEIGFSATSNERGQRVYVVRDNGAGFDMAYSARLFGVFQRLHTQEEFEGNGVGLATVQRIIRRHGGRIWAEGQPGRGATFFFTLNELSPTSALPASPASGE